MSSDAVKKHLEHFGLTCKEPGPLQNEEKVLGLYVGGNEERLRWRRVHLSSPVGAPFFVHGKLVGYFLVHGCLRVVVVAIK